MDIYDENVVGSSLRISTEVIEKIAKMAALEVEGVAKVTCGVSGVKSVLQKVPLRKPVQVVMVDDVAEVTIQLALVYGSKAPHVCKQVQQNIKSAIQNMTNVTVSKVHVLVTGVLAPVADEL